MRGNAQVDIEPCKTAAANRPVDGHAPCRQHARRRKKRAGGLTPPSVEGAELTRDFGEDRLRPLPVAAPAQQAVERREGKKGRGCSGRDLAGGEPPGESEPCTEPDDARDGARSGPSSWMRLW